MDLFRYSHQPTGMSNANAPKEKPSDRLIFSTNSSPGAEPVVIKLSNSSQTFIYKPVLRMIGDATRQRKINKHRLIQTIAVINSCKKSGRAIVITIGKTAA